MEHHVLKNSHSIDLSLFRLHRYVNKDKELDSYENRIILYCQFTCHYWYKNVTIAEFTRKKQQKLSAIRNNTFIMVNSNSIFNNHYYDIDRV